MQQTLDKRGRVSACDCSGKLTLAPHILSGQPPPLHALADSFPATQSRRLDGRCDALGAQLAAAAAEIQGQISASGSEIASKLDRHKLKLDAAVDEARQRMAVAQAAAEDAAEQVGRAPLPALQPTMRGHHSLLSQSRSQGWLLLTPVARAHPCPFAERARAQSPAGVRCWAAAVADGAARGGGR